jgi:hypothetical protein
VGFGSVRGGGSKLGSGSGAVRQYRIFVLNAEGRIGSTPYEFEADGDDAAVKIAEARSRGGPVELWCGNRKIDLGA